MGGEFDPGGGGVAPAPPTGGGGPLGVGGVQVAVGVPCSNAPIGTLE